MFIKFNKKKKRKRSICPPDLAIYLTLYCRLSGALIPSSLPVFLSGRFPQVGRKVNASTVPDLQYIKADLIQATLPNAKAFMWHQGHCGFIYGEKGDGRDWDEEVKTEEEWFND